MISDENLKKIIEEVMENEDLYLNDAVFDIVKKIIDLPAGIDATIANLINYNPEVNMVEPLTQGKIFNYVEKVCELINIEIERNDDKIIGLAYHCHFFKK